MKATAILFCLCALAVPPAEGAEPRRTLLVHPDEFTDRWVDRAVEISLDALYVHPAGGVNADRSLTDLLALLEQPAFRARIDRARAKGIDVGYEMHAASWLLPRELFDTHPEYFRMDKDGKRCRNVNFCFSDETAMDIAAKRAVELAGRLYGSSHKYFFWLDDVNGGGCSCETCRRYSESDQQLRFANRIVTELRKTIPDAKLCYLAYFATVNPPEKIAPAPGVFLEYAPYGRDMEHPIAGQDGWQTKSIGPLLEKLGRADARVLEYWFDNSLLSEWKKPPKKFVPRPSVVRSDLAFYRGLGFEDIASFACYLGDDYERLWGDPDVTAFAPAARMK